MGTLANPNCSVWHGCQLQQFVLPDIGTTFVFNLCNYAISSSRESRFSISSQQCLFFISRKQVFPSSQLCLFFISRNYFFEQNSLKYLKPAPPKTKNKAQSVCVSVCRCVSV